MTKGQRITAELRKAIAAGEKRTRKQWARHLNTNYYWLATIILDHNLQAACKPARAASSAGSITVTQRIRDGHYENLSIRIPACAIHAANLAHNREVRFLAKPGRILIYLPKSEVPK